VLKSFKDRKFINFVNIFVGNFQYFQFHNHENKLNTATKPYSLINIYLVYPISNNNQHKRFSDDKKILFFFYFDADL